MKEDKADAGFRVPGNNAKNDAKEAGLAICPECKKTFPAGVVAMNQHFKIEHAKEI